VTVALDESLADVLGRVDPVLAQLRHDFVLVMSCRLRFAWTSLPSSMRISGSPADKCQWG
jgi:hypothetical protein